MVEISAEWSGECCVLALAMQIETQTQVSMHNSSPECRLLPPASICTLLVPPSTDLPPADTTSTDPYTTHRSSSCPGSGPCTDGSSGRPWRRPEGPGSSGSSHRCRCPAVRRAGRLALLLLLKTNHRRTCRRGRGRWRSRPLRHCKSNDVSTLGSRREMFSRPTQLC